MFDIAPEFWQSLAQTSDALGVVTFLSGLVRYVGQKKSANEQVVIEEYLELVRRSEHKEICELLLNNAESLDSLRSFTAGIVAQSTDRILEELRKEFDDIKHLIAEMSDVPDQPIITARVSRHLGYRSKSPTGDSSFQLSVIIKNRSKCPANIRAGWAYLASQGIPIPCADGELIRGCRLPQQNDTRELHAHTAISRWPDGKPVLVCLKLEVEQDDGGFRYLIPRVRNETMELVNYQEEQPAGQKWMMRARGGRGFGPVTLLYPTDDLNGWNARDEQGQEFTVACDWLVATGMVPLVE